MSNTEPTKLWNRNFTILWASLVQSNLGDAFLSIGLMWFVLEMTGSPLAAGTVLAVQSLPKLLGPLAGAIVDQTSKRTLIIGGDLIRGIILILLFIVHRAGALQLWHLYLLVFILGAASIFYGPSLRVLLPHLVPDATLPAANSAIQAGQQASMILGTVVAGMALAIWGAPLALLLDGISYLIAAAIVGIFVQFPSALLEQGKLNAQSILNNMVSGLRYISSTKEILSLAALAFFLNLVLSPVNVIFPVLSRDVLGEGVTGYGFLAAAISAGLLLGSIVAGVIADRLSYKYSIFVGLVGMSSVLMSLSFVTALVPALLLVAGLGMMAPIIQIPLVSHLQRVVPQTYQGRVFASLETMVTLAIPIAAALAGQLLVTVKISVVFFLASGGSTFAAILWFIVSLRNQTTHAPAIESSN